MAFFWLSRLSRVGGRRTRYGSWLQFARVTSLKLTARDPFDIPETQPHALFHRGYDRRATNLAHGTHKGRRVLCFDYRYTEDGPEWRLHIGDGGGPRMIGEGRTSQLSVGISDGDTTHEMTCVIVEAPIMFPDLVIRPEKLMDLLGELIEAEDIDFESDRFSRKYRVTCDDRRFAYDVLHTQMIEFLLRQRPLAIGACGEWVLMRYAKERLLPIPHGVAALLETGGEFIELLPKYVLKERSRSTRE